MMTENAFVKMPARRSLSDVLGEPDHEQNKRDLDFWNAYFDRQFQSRWGIDPKTGQVDGSRWQKIGPDEHVPSAYCASTLEWACNPKKRSGRCCTHLGLQSARTGSPVQGKPLGEVNTNSITCTSPVEDLTSAGGQFTPILASEDSADLVRSQCESPTPNSAAESPSSSRLISASSSSSSPFQSSSPCRPGSRKRKQSTISEYFPQKKRTRTAKRRIILN